MGGLLCELFHVLMALMDAFLHLDSYMVLVFNSSRNITYGSLHDYYIAIRPQLDSLGFSEFIQTYGIITFIFFPLTRFGYTLHISVVIQLCIAIQAPGYTS